MGLKQSLSSTIGSKYLVAFTGFGLFGYVIIHMLGNLQIFLGPEALNSYAYTLKSNRAILWGARAILLVIFVLHIAITLRLMLLKRKARPTGYVYEDTVEASLASRTMLWTGLVILAFVIYHLLHFTVGVTNPGHFEVEDPAKRHDVYRMVVLGFQKAPVTVAYIIAQLALGMHLFHGSRSMFQSLGIRHPRWTPILNKTALFLSFAVVVGNIVIALACLTGVVPLEHSGYETMSPKVS